MDSKNLKAMKNNYIAPTIKVFKNGYKFFNK